MSDEEEAATAHPWRERLIAGAAISLLLLFAACSGLITFLELPLRLALGWIWHLVQAAPVLLPRWREALLPLACLVTATWFIHRFIRWWLAAKGTAIEWRARHTVVASALVLSGAAAAIAMSGVVHQAVWMLEAPWWVNRNKATERTEATNKIKQLLFALAEFEADHGHYPESLAELEVPRKFLEQSPAPGLLPEPMLYLKPDPVMADDEETIVLVSPVLGSDRVVVGFRSLAAQSVDSSLLPQILETRRMPKRGKP